MWNRHSFLPGSCKRPNVCDVIVAWPMSKSIWLPPEMNREQGGVSHIVSVLMVVWWSNFSFLTAIVSDTILVVSWAKIKISKSIRYYLGGLMKKNRNFKKYQTGIRWCFEQKSKFKKYHTSIRWSNEHKKVFLGKHKTLIMWYFYEKFTIVEIILSCNANLL